MAVQVISLTEVPLTQLVDKAKEVRPSPLRRCVLPAECIHSYQPTSNGISLAVFRVTNARPWQVGGKISRTFRS